MNNNNNRRLLNDICVYIHIRTDNNNIFYVGIGNSKRPYEKTRRNKHWLNTVRKTEYYVIVVHEDLTWDEACEIEKSLIMEIGRRDINKGTLVNMTNGGEGALGAIQSKESIEKSASAKRGKKRPQEVVERVRLKLIGRKIPKEYVEKRLNTMRKKYEAGWRMPKEAIEKTRLCKIGVPRSDETRRKLSIALTGFIQPKEMIYARQKSVCVKTLNKHGIVSDDIQKFAEDLINAKKNKQKYIKRIKNIANNINYFLLKKFEAEMNYDKQREKS